MEFDRFLRIRMMIDFEIRNIYSKLKMDIYFSLIFISKFGFFGNSIFRSWNIYDIFVIFSYRYIQERCF